MKDCCKTNKNDQICIRNSDKKIFNLPRKFSKKTCLEEHIKGFTKRASCAPYNICIKKIKKTKKGNKKKPKIKQKSGNRSKNILGKKLKICSKNPITGYYRDGYCETGLDDSGTHTVCAKMTKAFLKFTKNKGNDLSTPNENSNFPGLKENDRWCLCQYRWKEALDNNNAPKVIKESTNNKTDSDIINLINNLK